MALQAVIEQKLQAELKPSFLDVINESSMHNAPPGAESHFKVTVVSEKFEGEPPHVGYVLRIVCSLYSVMMRGLEFI